MSMSREEPQTSWVDPIVAEVHAARDLIMAAFDGDLHALCERLRARQQTAGRIPLRHESRPPRPESGRAAWQVVCAAARRIGA